MRIISLLILVLAAVSFLYYLFAFYCTRVFFKRGQLANPVTESPPVSIIKPLAEGDERYLEGLGSFISQDYPLYEVVFVLSENATSLIAHLEGLKERFPKTEIRWLVVKENKGPNYKVGNIIRAIEAARYDVLVISDSDMRVDPAYLRQVVAPLLRERVGLVTCLYRGVQLHNLYGVLQSLFIQTDFIPNVILGYKLEGISYAFGATICTSKAIVSSIGGFQVLQEYLADDYQIGNRIHKAGYEICISPYIVDDMSGMATFGEYFRHHLRWAITQRACRPIGYFASIVTQGVLWSSLFLLVEGLSPLAVALFVLVCGVRLTSSAYLNRAVIGNGAVGRYLWVVPFKDLWNSINWLISLFVNTVHWKHRRFRLLRGGKMVEV